MMTSKRWLEAGVSPLRLALVAGALFIAPLATMHYHAHAAPADAAWTVFQALGDVRVLSNGGTAWQPAGREQRLAGAYAIETGPGGQATLTHGDDVIHVLQHSKVEVRPPSSASSMTEVMQMRGTLLFGVEGRLKRRFKVTTPYVVTLANGTTFSISVTDAGADVSVAEGRVAVFSASGSDNADVSAGQVASVSATQRATISIAPVSAGDFSQLRPIAMELPAPGKGDQIANAGALRPAGAPTALAQREPDRGPSFKRRGDDSSFFSSIDHRFDARVSGGYDSNPLKVNDGVAQASALGELSLRYVPTGRLSETNRLRADARLRLRKYDVSEADTQDAEVAVSLISRAVPRFSRSTIGAGYGISRQTLIDQATGREETSSGQLVGTRFDNNTAELFAELTPRTPKSTTIKVGGAVEHRDYVDDFTALGLDRLDFTQVTIEPSIEQDFGGGFSADVDVDMRARFYADRRAEDAADTDIPGSDLRYYYLTVEPSATQRIGDDVRVTLGVEFERRIDNEVGADNRTEVALFGRFRYDLPNDDRVSVDAKWSRRVSDETDLTAVFTEDTGGSKRQGYRVGARYTRALEIGRFTADLLLRGRYEAFDNADDEFDYNRVVVTGGLRKRF